MGYTKGEWHLEEIPYETNDPAGGWYLHFDPTGDTGEEPLYLSKSEISEANVNLMASAPKLDRYREYVDAKIDIGEIPLRYDEFEDITIAETEGG